MYFLYSFMLAFWSALLLPFFLYRAWRRHTGLPGFSERMGSLPESLRFDGRKTVWFHSCSVGETLSLQPLARALQGRFPGMRFVFSTTTPTGQAIARVRFSGYGSGNTFYFPIDLVFAVNRVLDWIRPDMIVIVDTEIWPNLLRRAHLRNIPVLLVNGRISKASFRYYRWLHPFLKNVLEQYKALMMQSEDDAARILKMGAPAKKTTVTGNLKFDGDTVNGQAHETLLGDMKSAFALTDEDLLIVAGSTHQDEEQILLETLRYLRKIPGLEKTRLLLAPRHPERFEHVAQLIVQSGFRLRRRTGVESTDSVPEVILLDTIGELATAYRLATAVFIGGTLTNHGGHSIMEPAICSKAIVVGSSMENFQPILKEFIAHNGIHQIRADRNERESQLRQLQEIFRLLLTNRETRDAMGLAARSVLDRNRGAVLKTVREIESIIT